LTGNLATARAGHEATLLPDGRVLITGGVSSSLGAPYLQSAEIYDPQSGAFTPTGNMNDPRVDHTATLLDTGKVLVAGGYAQRGSRNGVTSTTELYDPQTGTFSIIAEMNFHRFKHSAVRLSDGRVLIAGGIASYPDAPRPYTTAEIYDPATNSFVKTGDMIVHRFKVKDGAVLLKNGKVLIAGGSWGFEVYDPATGTFSMNTNGLALSRYYSTATLLTDGRVLIAGGYSSTQPNDWYHANASAWIYQPD
jgi:hypothetical protein